MITMQNVRKTYGNFTFEISMELPEGQILGWIGKNGAGKSTFLNIMSGTYQQDTGEILLNNEPVEFKIPLAAKEKGIIKVHQELQLIPELSVAQNMFLGNEITNRFGMLDYKEMGKRQMRCFRSSMPVLTAA